MPKNISTQRKEVTSARRETETNWLFHLVAKAKNRNPEHES